MLAVRPTAQSLRIAALYGLFAGLWILISDQAIAWLVSDPAVMTVIAELKGCVFVLVTALLLFLLLRRQLAKIDHTTAALRATEKRYRLFADNVADVLWVLDLQTERFTFVSPSVQKLRGYTAEEVLKQHVSFSVVPHSLDFIRAEIPRRLKAFKAGDPSAVTCTYEIEQPCKDGGTIWTEMVTTYRNDEHGGVEVIGVSRDATVRRAVQQQLRENQARLHRAEEIAGLGHWTVDLNLGVLLASPGAQQIYGLTRERLPFADLRGMPLPEYREPLDAALRALIEEDRPYDIEFRIRRPTDGQFVDVHSLAEYDPVSRTIFGTIQDVTERKRVMAELAASERKYRTLVNNVPLILFQIGADGCFRMSEGKGLAKLGLKPGEVVGRSVFEVYRDNPAICAQFQRALAGEIVQEPVAIGAYSFDVVYHPLRDSHGAVTDVIGLALDTTERKRTEELLRLVNAALAAAANAIAITDRNGRIVWSNPAFTALTQFSPEETVGRTFGQLLHSGAQDDAFYKGLWETILAGNAWHGELVNRRKDGGTYFEEQTITPVRNGGGEIAHFVAIKQDISTRKALEARLLRSQRLESVGRLAGGVAHDLNNILVPVLMAPAVLREAITDPSALQVLEAIETSAKRGASIIRQLLTFSRGGSTSGDRVLVQLHHVMRDMVLIMQETFPKNIAVRAEQVDDVWLVEGDATQLHQVLMNLCVNARDAMPEGGTLTLSLENVSLNIEAIATVPGGVAGDYVLLKVVDTGIGIAPENLDKIFDPFFTTKEVGKGTGLGLSTVLGIVQSLRGFLQVVSRVAGGTQFSVYLPASPAAPGPANPPADTSLPHGAGELVLLVDDEENTRKVVRRILERHSYRVVSACDGVEALAWYQQHRSDIAVVITDLLMPVMDGSALVQALRALDPNVPVIAISGNEGSSSPLAPPGEKISAFLPKPFTAPTLLQTVRGVLVARRTAAPSPE